jgi:hypothetical protein
MKFNLWKSIKNLFKRNEPVQKPVETPQKEDENKGLKELVGHRWTHLYEDDSYELPKTLQVPKPQLSIQNQILDVDCMIHETLLGIISTFKETYGRSFSYNDDIDVFKKFMKEYVKAEAMLDKAEVEISEDDEFNYIYVDLHYNVTEKTHRHLFKFDKLSKLVDSAFGDKWQVKSIDRPREESYETGFAKTYGLVEII